MITSSIVLSEKYQRAALFIVLENEIFLNLNYVDSYKIVGYNFLLIGIKPHNFCSLHRCRHGSIIQSCARLLLYTLESCRYLAGVITNSIVLSEKYLFYYFVEHDLFSLLTLNYIEGSRK